MDNRILNKKTGAIALKDGFVLTPWMEEVAFLEHFKLDKLPESKWGTRYSLKNIEAGDWFFLFQLHFLEGKLSDIVFYLSKTPFPEKIEKPEREDWGPSNQEIEQLNMFEQWLTQQVGKKDHFSWGRVSAIYRPQPDGPQEPIIYLEYKNGSN